MTLVLDASALVVAAVDDTGDAIALRRRLGAEVVHAPHLIDAEVGNVLRRLVARELLAEPHARLALTHAPVLVDHRHEHTGELARAAWALRERVTVYDALYVSLAAALGAPLVTADAKLAGAGGLPCAVDVVGS